MPVFVLPPATSVDPGRCGRDVTGIATIARACACTRHEVTSLPTVAVGLDHPRTPARTPLLTASTSRRHSTCLGVAYQPGDTRAAHPDAGVGVGGLGVARGGLVHPAAVVEVHPDPSAPDLADGAAAVPGAGGNPKRRAESGGQ